MRIVPNSRMPQIRKYVKKVVLADWTESLHSMDSTCCQRSSEHLEWVGFSSVTSANEFVSKNNLLQSSFVTEMNRVFETDRFNLLLQRWTAEYLYDLFNVFHDLSVPELQLHKNATLEDNALNRFAAEKYAARFGTIPGIRWVKQEFVLLRFLRVMLSPLIIIYLSLNSGLRFGSRRKKYKVMREGLWGLYDVNGKYFHDDFLVDENRIKKEDLLLFSRGIPTTSFRLEAYHDMRRSPYCYFDTNLLPVSARSFVNRIIPKYLACGTVILAEEILSVHFSLFWNIFLAFLTYALRYEKVFSNFEVACELGHNYFSFSHIPESIICQNHGTKYYLMHWSDNSIHIGQHLLSFLACDSFLLWGKVHLQGVEGNPEMFLFTGYVFKKFIKEVITSREVVLPEMGIKANGRIVTFFDESFGKGCKMTEEHFVTFWKTALTLARRNVDITVVMKPKELSRYKNLSQGFKKTFLEIKDAMEKMRNMYIIDENKWSFIEVIGISDIVVTQGMTSSATIAIICGIEGLYLDQAGYDHPFSKLFRDKIAFDNPEKLLSMIEKIAAGVENPLEKIPEKILREYDEYSDDRGIDMFREILSGNRCANP